MVTGKNINNNMIVDTTFANIFIPLRIETTFVAYAVYSN